MSLFVSSLEFGFVHILSLFREGVKQLFKKGLFFEKEVATLTDWNVIFMVPIPGAM